MGENAKTIIGVIGHSPHVTLAQVIEEYQKSKKETISKDPIDEIVEKLNLEIITINSCEKDEHYNSKKKGRKKR